MNQNFTIQVPRGILDTIDADYLISLRNVAHQLNGETEGIVYQRSGDVITLNLYQNRDDALNELKDAISEHNAENERKESVSVAVIDLEKFYLV